MKAYVFLAGTMLASPAMALDPCVVSKVDDQVRSCIYDPQQRYVVSGIVGEVVNLRFGDTEQIKRTEFAYSGVDKDGKPSKTWTGPRKKTDDDKMEKERFRTNLPIWPMMEGHSSLVVITAMPDGSERAYKFVLVARRPEENCLELPGGAGCSGDRTTTGELSFFYPVDKALEASKAAAEKQQRAVVAWHTEQAAKKEQQAIARLKTDVSYGERNWAYQAKADPKYKALAPTEVSDNGWLTEFQWPGNVQPPAIMIIDPATGEPRSADAQRQGSMYVVDTTAPHFRLLLGKQAVMDIYNRNWKPQRPDPGTGTTSYDVIRTVTYRDGK